MKTIRNGLYGLCFLLSALAGTAALAQSDDLDFTVIFYTDASVEFWNPAIRGVKDAAEQLDVDVDIQFGDSSPEVQNDVLQAAIANEVDGIGLAIYNDDAFNEAVCQAEEAGITVIAFNVDHSQGAAGSCRSAYIGQNMEFAGELIAQRMIDDFGIGKGDLVLAPVEIPEATYAVQRAAGVTRALEAVGAKVEVIRSTTNPGEAQGIISQFLLSRPETKAIIGLGQTPTNAAPAAMKEVDVKLPLGGFDLSPDIGASIKAGDLRATVDQQPYSQGYFTVVQLVLAARYGLAPSTMDTGGTGLVDKSNVDLALELMGEIR